MGEGPVRQHCPLWWHHHVPRNCRQNAEGDHCPGSLNHEDQDHRSPREEVLRLDRRLHPGFPLHLPADVDLQAGVRRVRPLHCAQEVFLRSLQLQATSATLPPCDLGRPPDIVSGSCCLLSSLGFISCNLCCKLSLKYL